MLCINSLGISPGRHVVLALTSPQWADLTSLMRVECESSRERGVDNTSMRAINSVISIKFVLWTLVWRRMIYYLTCIGEDVHQYSFVVSASIL